MKSSFDVVVIGAGPGGYVAAIRASQLGFKTAIIEKEHMGGICLNWGCIPTKALLKASEVMHTIEKASEFGIKVGKPTFDFKKVIERSRGVASKLSKGIDYLMQKNKVEVIKGTAKITGKNKISVDSSGKSQEIQAKNIIIATGARARVLSGLEPDNKHIWTYKEAMTPDTMPKKLLVIGSGAIGIEFASFYNMMGADVTVLEIAPRILMAEDSEVAAAAHKSFEKQGMKIVTGSKANKAEVKSGKVNVSIEDKDGKASKETFDRVIVAAGVVPNVENIGLEELKIDKDKSGFIKTNEFLQTNVSNIYAIGDVTEAPWLAHKASHEGVIAVEHITKKQPHPMKKENIPGCTYCYPQIASVGLTEDKAKELGKKIKVGRFPFSANGKAIALGETEGFVKTIFDEKTGELLGAHMIGAEVTEMIQGFVVAKSLETTEEDLMHTIFPHPTLSEMMHESVLDAFDKVIHT